MSKRDKKGISGVMKSRLGVSMTEMMIAILIISVGIIGIARLLLFSISGNKFNMEMARAVSVAEDTVDWFRNLEAESTCLDIEYTTTHEIIYNDPYTVFKATMNVISSSGSPDLRRACITVTWEEKGNPYSIKMYAVRRYSQ